MKFAEKKDIDAVIGRLAGNVVWRDDMRLLVEHIKALENFLDNSDDQDTFGTEGWRHTITKNKS